MDKATLIANIKKLGQVDSVTGDASYRLDSVDNNYIYGTRLSSYNDFKIDIDELLKAYNDIVAGIIPMTTTALKKPGYITHRVQSPSLAIIIALRKL